VSNLHTIQKRNPQPKTMEREEKREGADVKRDHKYLVKAIQESELGCSPKHRYQPVENI